MIRSFNLIFCFLAWEVSAQTGVYLYFDKPFYMTGETAFFVVSDNTDTNWPGYIMRLTVHDENKKLVRAFHLESSDPGPTSGYLDIPNTWSEGVYWFTSSVFDQSSSRMIPLVSRKLFIYDNTDLSPRIKWIDGQEAALPEAPLDTSSKTVEGVFITKKDTVLLREMQNITIKSGANFPLETVAVSVRDSQLAGHDILGYPSLVVGDRLQEEISPSRFINAQLDIGHDLTTFPDAVFFLDQQNLKVYELEHEENKSFLRMIPDYGVRKLQAVGDLSRSFEVKDILGTDHLDPEATLPMNERIVDAIKKSTTRRKIDDWFAIDKAPQSLSEKITRKPKASFSHRPGDYKTFETMEVFLREVSSPLKVRSSRKKGVELRLTNPEDKPFFAGDPLLIVNGVVMDSIEYVLSLDPESISKIDYYNTRRSLFDFESLGSNGVVAVTSDIDVSFSQNFVLIEFDGLQTPVSYPVQIKPVQENFPYFGTSIYWNPSLSANEKGEIEFSFHHSDDVGKFEIEVFAIDKAGNAGIYRSYYFAKTN